MTNGLSDRRSGQDVVDTLTLSFILEYQRQFANRQTGGRQIG